MTALIWLLVRQHRPVKYFYTYISPSDWCTNPFYVGYVPSSRVGERAVPFLEGFFFIPKCKEHAAGVETLAHQAGKDTGEILLSIAHTALFPH